MKSPIRTICRTLLTVGVLIASSLAFSQTVIPARVSVTSAGQEVENPYSNYTAISADGKYAAFVSDANNLVPGDHNNSPDIFRKNLVTGVIEPVCVTPSGVWENANSWDTFISSDGRFIVFTSNSNNLDPNLSPNSGPNVYLKDMVTGTVELVSVATGHKLIHGRSLAGSVSDDGRYVAFESDATDAVPNDTNGVTDVFVYDRVTKVTKRISVANDGTQANGQSLHTQISANGQWVVFQSDASNLVPNDTNTNTDIFLVNNINGGIQRISVATGGKQADYSSFDPTINADGTVVGFVSWASNLDGPSNGTCVYVRDLNLGTTTRVSKNRDGTYANGSWLPTISSTGRYVVYESWSNNIIANDSNGDGDVFEYDRQTGTTQICSVSSTGVQGTRQSNTDFGRRGVTTDGRFVVFSTASPELDATCKNNTWNAYIRDTTAKTTKRLSVAPSGTEIGGGASRHPSMSADGRYVVYGSFGANIVPGDNNDAEDIFLYDRNLKTTQWLSAPMAGVPQTRGWWQWSTQPDISSDGTLVAFSSRSDTIVDGHPNTYGDIFVRNVAGGTTAWISGSKQNPSNGDSWNPRISQNNRYVVYTSSSTTILPGINAGVTQIYEYDRTTGKTVLVSVNNLGQQGNGNSAYPSVSGDGRYVAFQSYSNNLVANDTNNCADIFVRDTVANVTIRVSLGNDGSQAVADCLRPWITPDGKKVAFDTIAGNLVVNDTNNAYDVFVRDLAAGTTVRASTATGGVQVFNGDSNTAYISNDGRYVTFGSWSPGLVPNDLNGTRDLFRKDLLTGVTIMLDVNSAGVIGNDWLPNDDCPYMLSANGQTVAYASLSNNLVAGDTNQDWDIFVADIKTDIGIGQVSVTPGTIQSGDTTTLTVALTSPAPTGGLVVNLQSNNSAATVPASITIPSGQTTGTATVTGGSPLASTTVTLTASYSGSSKTVNVVVRPWLTSLTLSTTTVNGGAALTGTIQLVSPASTGGVVVTLASSDSTGATVPASIKIVAGADHASFTIATVLVTADKPVKITATIYGYSLSANLTVKAVGVSIAITPRVVVGGGPNAAGVVTIGSPAGPGGLVVNLTFNSPSATVPATVTVPAGKVKAAFSIIPQVVTKPTTATVTASLSAKVSASTTLAVNPIGPQSLLLFSSPTTSGTDVLAAVQLNAPAPTGGLTITITTSDSTVAQPELTIFIPAGQTVGWFDIDVPTRTASATATITVTANNLSVSSLLTVNP